MLKRIAQKRTSLTFQLKNKQEQIQKLSKLENKNLIEQTKLVIKLKKDQIKYEKLKEKRKKIDIKLKLKQKNLKKLSKNTKRKTKPTLKKENYKEIFKEKTKIYFKKMKYINEVVSE